MKKEKKYPGQKKINGLFHKIINNIPVHLNYVEPFAGTAAIAQILAPLTDAQVQFYLSDNDAKVIESLHLAFEPIIGRRVHISLNNFFATVKRKEFIRDTFFFIDPPYLHSTRPNSKSLYVNKLSDNQHKELLLTVLSMDCKIMVIHPKCELYDTMLKDWRKVPVKVRYHNKTSNECLYMNYQKPMELQTDVFLGEDCWDRQRIVRKAKRWTNRLSELPILERKAIIKFMSTKIKEFRNG